MYGNYGIPGVPLVSGVVPASVPLNEPNNLFRYGEQSLWSTQYFTQAEEIANGTFRLFNAPLGEVGQGAARAMSIAETNLKEGGRIPNGVAYDVYGLAAQFMAQDAAADTGNQDVPFNGDGAVVGSITDIVNMINSGALSWDFTQTQVDIAPLHLVGAGGGAFGAFAIDNAGAAAEATAGSAQSSNGAVWIYRKHPVALPGASTFSILLRFGLRAEAISNVATTIGVRVVLYGYYKNVIEIG